MIKQSLRMLVFNILYRIVTLKGNALILTLTAALRLAVNLIDRILYVFNAKMYAKPERRIRST